MDTTDKYIITAEKEVPVHFPTNKNQELIDSMEKLGENIKDLIDEIKSLKDKSPT
jgi:hypothetical protein